MMYRPGLMSLGNVAIDEVGVVVSDGAFAWSARPAQGELLARFSQRQFSTTGTLSAPLRLDRVRVAESVQDDVGALLGEGARHGEADAAGGAGDEGGLSFEHEASPTIDLASIMEKALTRT